MLPERQKEPLITTRLQLSRKGCATRTFVVIEGYSGSGKTTLSKLLARRGWVRIPESASLIPRDVPLGDRADTYSDYSLFGATLTNCYRIASNRVFNKVVADSYFLSDLTYAKIRQDLGKSEAFPVLLGVTKRLLGNQKLAPDFYILLKATARTIRQRQARKATRERIDSELFEDSYYSVIEALHSELSQNSVERVETDSRPDLTLSRVLTIIRKRALLAKAV